MLNFKTIGRIATAGAVLAFFVMCVGPVQARPAFVGVFKKTYPELAKSKDVKVNCTVCHNSKENKKKKHRNNYGVALKDALGKKNEKDKEKVAAALKKIADKDSHMESKKFGDLIAAGKLPGEDKAAD